MTDEQLADLRRFVKPLEWVYGKADSETGVYVVDSGWKDRIGGNRWWAWFRHPEGASDPDPFYAWQYGERHETEDAAKAAAQADYADRILSAVPALLDEVVRLRSEMKAIELRAFRQLDIGENHAAGLMGASDRACLTDIRDRARTALGGAHD